MALSFTLEARTLTAKRNGDWNSASTWNGGNKPGPDDDVIILGYTVTVNGTFTCKTLTLDDASALSGLVINSGASLTVTGSTVATTNNGAGSGGTSITINGTLNAQGGLSLFNESTQVLGLLVGNTNQVFIGSASSSGLLNTTDIYMENALSILPLGFFATTNVINLRHGDLAFAGTVTLGDIDEDRVDQYNAIVVDDSGDFDELPKNIDYSSMDEIEIFQGRFDLLGGDANTNYTFKFVGTLNQQLRFENITYSELIISKPSGGVVFMAENLPSDDNLRSITVRSNSQLEINQAATNFDALTSGNSFILESGAVLRVSGNAFADALPSKSVTDIAPDAIVDFSVTEGNNATVFQEEFFYPIVQLTGTGTKTFNGSSLAINNSTNTAERIELKEGTWDIASNQTLVMNTAGAEGIVALDSNTTLKLQGDFAELSAFWDIDRDNTFDYSGGSTQNILVTADKIGDPEPYGILQFSNQTGAGTAVKTLPNEAEAQVANRINFLGNTQLDLTESSQLRLLSNIDFTAFVSEIPSSAAISYTGTPEGKFVVEKYVPLPYRAYRDIASPIIGTTLASWIDEGINMRGFPGSNSPSAGRTTVTRYDESVQGNLNLGFVNATNATNPIREENGGEITQSVFRILDGNNSNLDFAVTLEDDGEIFTGDQNFNINFTYSEGEDQDFKDFNDGWNLIGNPYPAPLNWDAVVNDPDNADLFTDGKLDPCMYIIAQIDRFFADANNPGFYGFYNSATGFQVIHDNQIPSYQGFWVKAFNDADANTSYDLTIKESHKGAVTDSRFYKNNLRDGRKAINPETDAVSLTIFQEDRAREKVWFHYWPKASVGEDTLFDVAKFGQPAPTATAIDFVDNNRPMNMWVNALPEKAINFQLPLYVQLPKAGNYSVSFGNLGVFTDKFPCAYLLDQVTGRTLDLATDTVFNFSTETEYSGNRFIIYLNQNLTARISTEDAPCAGEPGTLNLDFSELEGAIDFDIVDVNSAAVVEKISGQGIGVRNLSLPAGNYLVRNNNGLVTCYSNQLRVDINQPAAVIANFTSEDTSYTQFESVALQNNSSNASQFTWFFEDDGSISMEENPTHVFNFPGVFDITLVAFNADSTCSSETTRTYTVSEVVSVSENLKAQFDYRIQNNTVYFEGMDAQDSWEYQIMDIQGRVLDQNWGTGAFNIALPEQKGTLVIINGSINSEPFYLKLQQR